MIAGVSVYAVAELRSGRRIEPLQPLILRVVRRCDREPQGKAEKKWLEKKERSQVRKWMWSEEGRFTPEIEGSVDCYVEDSPELSEACPQKLSENGP